MAALAVPGFVKARKQSQARRIINDARQLDAAIDQWALEKGITNGTPINTSEAAMYLKEGWKEVDILGNRYEVSVVGPNQIMISPVTKEALDGVGVDWGSF
jgi:type II secretory pathway pseudopilin PulG